MTAVPVPPTAYDRQLVRHTLALFTPWGAVHVLPLPPDRSMRDTHFDGASARSDWDWIHTLIDPAGAGLPRLIRQYNQQFPTWSDERLKETDHMLAIPDFAPCLFRSIARASHETVGGQHPSDRIDAGRIIRAAASRLRQIGGEACSRPSPVCTTPREGPLRGMPP